MATWCKLCKTIHDVDGAHTRPQPLPKDNSTTAPELRVQDDDAELANLRAEVKRWQQRVKVLEARNEAAAKLLRGES